MVTDKQPSRTPTQEIPVVAEPYSEAWFLQQVQNHPTTQDCAECECSICAWRDCPHHDPMHYHHDGCPCCDVVGCEACKTIYDSTELACPECGVLNLSPPAKTSSLADASPPSAETETIALARPEMKSLVKCTRCDTIFDTTDAFDAHGATCRNEIAPVPEVRQVHFDAWNYGERVWVERRIEGDHVDLLNRLLSAPRAFDSVFTAVLRTGDELRSWGVRAFTAHAVVHAHPEEKPAPRRGSIDDLWGEIDEPNLKVEFGGGCPIQGYGVAYGHPLYYRARGCGWSVDFWEPGTAVVEGEDLPGGEIWRFERDDCAWPDAGWLHNEESTIRIREAAAAFAVWKATQ